MTPLASANWWVLLLGIGLGMAFSWAYWAWRRAGRRRTIRRQVENHRAEIEQMQTQLESQGHDTQQTRRMADLGQLASGIAHDICGPLTVVVGTVQMMMEDEAARRFQADLARIFRAAQLCQTIASNILTFAKSQDVETGPCDLRRVVESALDIYGPTLAERKISITTDFPPRLCDVTGSGPQLERVLLNLLSNARSAMPAGGQLRIAIEEFRPRPFSPPWIQVVVEDSGPGVSAEALARIFKPFNTTKAANEGTGIGLYVSRQIALDHKGRLHVENRDEGGARFVLSLPSAAIEVPSELRAAA
jgi:signal transduction histidine kinase